MAIQGLRTSELFTVTGQRPKNWREGILLNSPNGIAPLYALTSLMKNKVTDDPEFNWFEKILPTQRILITEDLDNVETAIDVQAGSGTDGGGNSCKVGDVFRIEESGELVRVTSVSSDTLVNVTRGFSGTTATAALCLTGVGVNPYMFKVGSVMEEGSAAPAGVSYDPTQRMNYTQIFRDTLELTRTAAKTRLRTGEAQREAKREALEAHACAIEKALIFGVRALNTVNSKPARQFGGIKWFLDTYASGNVIAATSQQASLTNLEDWLEQAFRYGSSEKLAFTGNIGMKAIQRAIRKNLDGGLALIQGQKEFGMNVSRLVCPFGELVIKTHPLFNQITGGTAPATGAYYSVNSWLLILDMADFTYRFLTDSDTKFEGGYEVNGEDQMKSGYLTECGLELHHPNHHMLVTDIVTGVAD